MFKTKIHTLSFILIFSLFMVNCTRDNDDLDETASFEKKIEDHLNNLKSKETLIISGSEIFTVAEKNEIETFNQKTSETCSGIRGSRKFNRCVKGILLRTGCVEIRCNFISCIAESCGPPGTGEDAPIPN